MATNKVKVDITADGSGFHRTLSGMGSALTGLKAKLAAAFSVGTIGYVSKQILDFGDSIQKMADDFDISTDAAQRFQWAARNANIEIGTLEKGMVGLDTAMRKALGGDVAKKNVLAQLGISEKDLGALKKDEALLRILQTAKDKGFAANKTVGLLGELGIQPRVAQRIVSRTEDLLNKNIPIVSENTIKKLDALGDAFTNIKQIILQALIPALLAMAKAVLDFTVGWLEKAGKIDTYKKAGYDAAKAAGTTLPDLWASAKGTQHLSFEKFRDKRFWGGRATVVPGPTPELSKGVRANLTDAEKAEMQKLLDEYWLVMFGGNKNALEAAKNALNDIEGKGGTISKIADVLEKLREALSPQPGDPDFIGPVQPKPEVGYVREALRAKKKGTAPSYTDLGDLGGSEFLKIGGGLGINVQYRMERIAIQTRDYMARVAAATESIDDKMDADGGQEWGGEPN